jgi:uncharacterized protein YfeS
MSDEHKERNGVDKDQAHPRTRELVPEDFFWDCTDELAPFGSDEGDTALADFRDWRRGRPRVPIVECLKWTIESVGEMEYSDYSDALLSEPLIASQIADEEFDDQQYIFTVDVSVLATGFGQLLDEGHIDRSAKPIIARAISRQIIWARLKPRWEFSKEYIENLQVLERVLLNA